VGVLPDSYTVVRAIGPACERPDRGGTCVADAHISANTCRGAMVEGAFESSRRDESKDATRGSDACSAKDAARMGGWRWFLTCYLREPNADSQACVDYCRIGKLMRHCVGATFVLCVTIVL